MFPLILGTLFMLHFLQLQIKQRISQIPVAVVIENDTADTFKETISNIDKNVTKDNSSLLNVTYAEIEAAKELLEAESIDGIIIYDDTLSLEIFQMVLTRPFLRILLTITFISNLLKLLVRKIEVNLTAVEGLQQDTSYNTEYSYVENSIDPYILYFYSLIAMSCLFGSQLGFSCAKILKLTSAYLEVAVVSPLYSSYGRDFDRLLRHYLSILSAF